MPFPLTLLLKRHMPIAGAASLALLLGLAGCAEGPVKADPELVAELRSRFLLEEEPAGAVTPIGWREEQAEAEEVTEGTEEGSIAEEQSDEVAMEPGAEKSVAVVLVGKVGGMPNPWPDAEPNFPWRANEATFFLVDPGTAADFAEHAGEEGDDHAADCPFCAREATNKVSSIVAVSFLDPQGKPTSIDSRELLDIAAGDVVVVRGRLSTLLGGDLLVLEADGLYLRK